MHVEMHARKVYDDVWRDPGCQEFVRAQETCFAANSLAAKSVVGQICSLQQRGRTGIENEVGEDFIYLLQLEWW